MTHLLVGRDAEESQLRELVRGVANGEGRSVLVEGEPGIGKSLLISTGLAGAAGLGCRVLQAAADEFGGQFPLRVLLDCFVSHGVGDVASLTGGERGTRDGISAEYRLEVSWALAYSLLYSDPPEGARVAREALASDNGGPWEARVRAIYALILAADRHCGDAEAAIREAHLASVGAPEP